MEKSLCAAVDGIETLVRVAGEADDVVEGLADQSGLLAEALGIGELAEVLCGSGGEQAGTSFHERSLQLAGLISGLGGQAAGLLHAGELALDTRGEKEKSRVTGSGIGELGKSVEGSLGIAGAAGFELDGGEFESRFEVIGPGIPELGELVDSRLPLAADRVVAGLDEQLAGRREATVEGERLLV